MFLSLLSAPFVAPLLFGLSQEPVTAQTEPQSPVQGFDRLEIQANTFTSNRQQDATVAADAEGNLLVSWGSRRQEQGTYGVFAQLLDPRGRPLTTEIHVNQYLPSEQAKPAAIFDADGNGWILWHSVGQDGDGIGVFARRFGQTEQGFEALGDEFQVNDINAGDQMDAVLAALPGGGVVATWSGPEKDRRVLYARRFDANGQAMGKEFRLSHESSRGEHIPAITSTPTGVLAVWGRFNEAHSPEGIGACHLSFDAEGQPQRETFTVQKGDDAFTIEPSVDAAADGSFVVGWMASQGGSDYQAMVQRFDAKHQPQGEAMAVDAGGEDRRTGAQVAMAPDGRFVVAYNVIYPKQLSSAGHRPTEPTSIFARRFAADGSPLGEGFRLNQFDKGEQTLQSGINANNLLWTAQDQLLAAWHGKLPNDSRGVGVTMLVPEAFQPAAPAKIEPLAAALDITEPMVHGAKAKPDFDPLFVRGPHVPPPAAAGGSGGFEAIVNTGWTPPDPDLAVGPNHIVTVANGEISFHTKAGVRTFVDEIAGSGGFWGSVGAGGFVFDPVALYDPHTDRFVVAAADGAGSNDAIVLAMSDDNDPNGTWHKYRFVISGTCTFYDFPNLGINDEAIFLAGDCFSGGGNRVFMWDKSLVMNGSPVSTKQVQTSSGTQSLGATKNYDTNSPGYFATTYSSSSNRLLLKAITDPTGTPQLHQLEITVQGFGFPPDADQLGTSNKADTIDWRIKNGVVRNGSLWVAHNTGENNTARVRWHEIDLNGWPTSGSNPTVAQTGTLNFGTGEHNWFPDINVTDTGDAVIAFNRSSSSQYISVEFVTRKSSDAAGTMSAPKVLQNSTSPETGGRWGDYAGVEQDPLDPTTFWNHHAYRTGGWRTWVGEFATSQELSLATPVLVPGANSTFSASNANSGEDVHFLVSTIAGNWAPPQLGGLVLDLGAPATYLGSAVANGSGDASLFVAVPGGAPSGLTVYIQAAIVRGVGGIDSVKSNLVTTATQ